MYACTCTVCTYVRTYMYSMYSMYVCMYTYSTKKRAVWINVEISRKPHLYLLGLVQHPFLPSLLLSIHKVFPLSLQLNAMPSVQYMRVWMQLLRTSSAYITWREHIPFLHSLDLHCGPPLQFLHLGQQLLTSLTQSFLVINQLQTHSKFSIICCNFQFWNILGRSASVANCLEQCTITSTNLGTDLMMHKLRVWEYR